MLLKSYFTLWKTILFEKFNIFKLNFDFLRLKKMQIHGFELIKWNRISNFTRIIFPIEVIIKHFLDSISIIPFIQERSKILDIGTGAGFPGIPLKIMLPSIYITLVDSSRKKKAFLDHIIRTLNIFNINVINDRSENLAKINIHQNYFNVIISRAFTSIDKLMEISVPLLADNGIIIVLKGKVDIYESKIDNFNLNMNFIYEKNFFFINNYFYQLPVIRSQRNLIIIKHITN